MSPNETDSSSGSDCESDEYPALEPDFFALKRLPRDLHPLHFRWMDLYCPSLSPSRRFRKVPEHMAGKHLYKIWDRLSLEYQKAALTEIAGVVAQLAGLQFTKIGSLREDGTLGPLLHRTGIEVDGVDDWATISSGPFTNTFDYLFSFVKAVSFPPDAPPEETTSLTHEVQRLLKSYFSKHSGTRYLHPPFCLIHEDFDGQNMLFTDPDETGGQPPQLTAIIDWEFAHTGPLYFLYEYPEFIQDEDWSKHLYSRNAILRPHFVRALRAQFSSKSEEYKAAKECLPAAKCATLNSFKNIFMETPWEWDRMKRLWENYIADEIAGTGKAYGGRLDWIPDVDEP
ncbi:hypothetical protein BD410DRAFT_900896 [Rickenella mellea]|uniref:Aminoglycoside phosphotransferase domain-containing protein n=1 Tax=Rickenella mellea TaxID=50990 RepID=A0A4Y7PTY1_9AGAM|nr:hypothetical protein BD410DRAFT_900896 [Rickenella mellea]